MIGVAPPAPMWEVFGGTDCTVWFIVAQTGEPPRQLEKQDKVLIEMSGLIIPIKAFEQNEARFLMILIWALIKILQQNNQSSVM